MKGSHSTQMGTQSIRGETQSARVLNECTWGDTAHGRHTEHNGVTHSTRVEDTAQGGHSTSGTQLMGVHSIWGTNTRRHATKGGDPLLVGRHTTHVGVTLHTGGDTAHGWDKQQTGGHTAHWRTHSTQGSNSSQRTGTHTSPGGRNTIHGLHTTQGGTAHGGGKHSTQGGIAQHKEGTAQQTWWRAQHTGENSTVHGETHSTPVGHSTRQDT